MNKSIYAIIAFFALFLCSCKKEGSPSLDLNTLRPYKMDIVGAKSLGLNNGTRQKASYGKELYDKGIFKIDEQGNISTVAVYFVTDDDGNQSLNSYDISVVPNRMTKISPSFLLLTNCLYHSDDTHVYGLDYKNLLVRISDGLIFCVDNISDYMTNAFFIEDKNGTLYSNNGSVVGKITVSDGTATFQQINTTGSGIYGQRTLLLNNGIICSIPGEITDYTLITPYPSECCCLLWPNGGFQKMYAEDYWGVPSDIRAEPCFRTKFVITGDKILLTNIYRERGEQGCHMLFGYVNIGNTPDDASLGDPVLTIPLDTDRRDIYLIACCETDTHYILCFDTDNISAISIDKNSLEYKITDLPTRISLYDRCKFNGKYWNARHNESDETGFYWFDPQTLQSGFVKSDMPYIGISRDLDDEYKWDYTSGYITYEAVRPSDGYNITVKVDITTGRVETIERAPDKIFTTLITLS